MMRKCFLGKRIVACVMIMVLLVTLVPVELVYATSSEDIEVVSETEAMEDVFEAMSELEECNESESMSETESKENSELETEVEFKAETEFETELEVVENLEKIVNDEATSYSSAYDMSWVSLWMSIKIDSAIYTGNPIEPKVQILLHQTSNWLLRDLPDGFIEGTHYVINYSNNTEIGIATAEIEFINEYKGSYTVYFQIMEPTTMVYDTQSGMFMISSEEQLQLFTQLANNKLEESALVVVDQNGNAYDGKCSLNATLVQNIDLGPCSLLFESTDDEIPVVNLNLGGYELTSDYKELIFVDGADVTVSNGKLQSSFAYLDSEEELIYVSTGKLTLNHIEVVQEEECGDSNSPIVVDAGTLVANSIKIKANEECYALYAYKGSDVTINGDSVFTAGIFVEYGQVTFNDGFITSEIYGVQNINGSIIVNGGFIGGYDRNLGSSAYSPGVCVRNGYVEVNGGFIEGRNCGLYVSGFNSKVLITGGIIIGSGWYLVTNNSDYEKESMGVALENCTGDVTILGGFMRGIPQDVCEKTYAIYSFDKRNSSTGEITTSETTKTIASMIGAGVELSTTASDYYVSGPLTIGTTDYTVNHYGMEIGGQYGTAPLYTETIKATLEESVDYRNYIKPEYVMDITYVQFGASSHRYEHDVYEFEYGEVIGNVINIYYNRKIHTSQVYLDAGIEKIEVQGVEYINPNDGLPITVTVYAVEDSEADEIPWEELVLGRFLDIEVTYKSGYTLQEYTILADEEGWEETIRYQGPVQILAQRSGGLRITSSDEMSKNHYLVSFDANGGDSVSEASVFVKKGTTINSLPTTTREGYAFKGWFVTPEGDVQITTQTKIEANSTFYAQWAPKTYTITFHGNGSTSGKMKVQSYKYDTEVILSDNLFKKTGYEFYGWNTNADGSGLAFANLEEVVNPNGAANLTLYAQWKPMEYTIDYVLGGEGVLNPNAEKVIYNATQETYILENPTRPNYTFGGWYSDAKFKTKVTQIKAGSSGDKIFYAKWTINKYTIKFDANGGSGKTMKNLANCAYNQDYVLTKVGYKKNGYTFVGWNTKADGSGMEYANQAVISGLSLLGAESTNGTVITLYAQWDIDTYSIALEGIDGADNTINNDIPVTYNVESETIILKAPNKDGYTFKGWYTDAKLKKAVSYNKTTGEYTAVKTGSTGDKIIYAKWVANKYTIKFEANGGSGKAMKNLSATYDKDTTLINVSYKKTGYEFVGWNTNADGSGASYGNKETIKNLATSGTITLYAQWKVATYSIAYHVGTYAQNPNSVQEYRYGDMLNLKEPQKAGYIFKGWYSDAGLKKAIKKDAATGEYIAIKATDSGDKTFYAKWQAENLKYNIVFSSGEDNAIVQEDYAQNGVKLGKATALAANKFTKHGYTFLGWATEIGGEVKYTNKQKVTDISTTEMGEIKETVTLYPVFERTEYTITYTNGGVHDLDTSYNVDEDHNIDLTSTIPVKSGYTFVGWYTNKNLKDEYKIETLVLDGQTGNKKIYAKWIVNKYTIVFDSNTVDIQGIPLFGMINGETAEQSITYDKQAALKTNGFKLNGYKFVGWNTKADGSGEAYKNKQKVKNLAEKGVVTLYAQWEMLTYKLTYKNGGNYVGNDSYNVTMPIYLSKPTREGYTFEGWYSDAKFKKPVPLAPEFAIASGSIGNKTFYAKWKVNTYNITFDDNVLDGEVQVTGDMANINNCQYGKSYTLRNNAYKRVGYAFTGWNTEADGSGIMLKNKANVKNLGAKSENGEIVTLYAQWSRNEYTITYKLNGGINHKENPAGYTVEDAEIVLKAPGMDGYEFKGWYADILGIKKVESIDTKDLKNITLYAMWKKTK